MSLCLCVSQVLKLPGIGNTETQRTRRVCVKGVLISRTLRRSPTVQYPNPCAILLTAFQKNSVSLCLCVSNLCFKFPSPTQVSWQTFCHASNLAHPNNFHNENGTTWALRFSPKLQKIQFQKIHNVFNPNTLDLIVNDAWIESTSFTSAKSLKIRELPIAKTGFSGSGSGFAVCERDLSNAACCRCCVETLS